jgi:hypothetical protein
MVGMHNHYFHTFAAGVVAQIAECTQLYCSLSPKCYGQQGEEESARTLVVVLQS